MQQILEQLQQGEHEVVKDRQDGTLEMRVKAPTSLNLRAARLIKQLVTERDQVNHANIQLNAHLHHSMQEIEILKRQLKEAHDRINSSPVPPADTTKATPGNSGTDSGGETKSPESQAS